MKRPIFPTLFALSCCLVVHAGARAGFVNWTYEWSRLPADVVSADANGTSKLSLTDEVAGHATNSSDIVATNIRSFSTAPRATPNNFQDAAYALTLKLTDDASGQSGTLTFNGTFNGTLSASSANIDTAISSAKTQELTLGDNHYRVTMDDYSPPGPPGITNAGSIGASVEVTPAADPAPDPDPPPPPPPNDAPEPSTLLLSGLGLTSLGAEWWRRRRTTRAPSLT